ncbi:SPOR domain-containing protein [Pontixanthobacter sp.]|uniref:SPOR domain-containing protein n=1 Tax=Pontixanthobacter sp. TaxID=2792078 RepID=UPI003C7EA7C5
MLIARALKLMVAGGVLAASGPALADVKAGVDAWSAGNYSAAVAEWRGPSNAGDPDAQFNMAQAYRLGRGVEANAKQAEILYAKAAAQGHIKAADNYGLLLFQDGRREEAMPYVTAAADRGDPRAQYLIGIAHFNGDLLQKDWVRAYALLTLANSTGLPQAKPAIAQMDDFIPLAQRQEAQIVAQSLKRQAESNRAQQLAAADLGVTQPSSGAIPARVAPNPPRPTPAQVAAAASVRPVLPSPVNRIPQPIERTVVAPSIAAARTAVSEAERVTGTETPATAGADFTRPAASTPAPVRTASAPPPGPSPRAAAPSIGGAAPADQGGTPETSASGPWRVQLGAFGVRSNADRLWSRLSGNSALRGTQKLVVPSGRLVRLQAAGFTSRGAAQSACNALKRSGQSCLVTK